MRQLEPVKSVQFVVKVGYVTRSFVPGESVEIPNRIEVLQPWPLGPEDPKLRQGQERTNIFWQEHP
jgi:hypothetical protein